MVSTNACGSLAANSETFCPRSSMILDTLRAQGKMLQQLTKLAREEPASSPLMQSLDDLTTAITSMDGNLQGMAVQLEDSTQGDQRANSQKAAKPARRRVAEC